jgi:HEPN domain-containing protein
VSSAAAAAWLEKAAKDLDAVRRSVMPLPDQNLETAAYHTQQAAEKGVKALLTYRHQRGFAEIQNQPHAL